jgi:oxygen-independent coproporphyrinogen-3 oxidase
LRAVLPEDWETGGFGLYLHWPFCQAKCPYCDFNSHVAASIDQQRWQRAYLHEIDRIGAQTKGRILRSVFFGGGTPSLMEPSVVAAVIERIRRTWATTNDLEITLEANPTSVEAQRLAGFRDAGVNRISLGLQALNDPDLRALGRMHSVAEGLAAYDIARQLFPRVSFDLIYARQGQTAAGWELELRQALTLAADHLSLYQLTIEDGTVFGARQAAGKLRGLPDDDTAADMYLATQEICAEFGFAAYEVSNHAKPGQESRHNQIYWKSGDYVGIGPGAHGRLTLDGSRLATATPLVPGEWLKAVERTGSGELPRERLSDAEHATEFLLMGLRLAEGVSMHRIPGHHDPEFLFNMNTLAAEGLLNIAKGQLTVSAAGRPLLNEVLRRLLVG